MSRYVISLSSRAALQPAISGGKGSGLAWLSRQPCKVPDGFVITTAAFRDFLAACALGSTSGDADGASRAVETAPFPPRIAQAIVEAYRRLGGPVAVRSSLVGEDAGSASFAGQFSSHLQVEGEEALLTAVRASWASLFAHTAAAYLGQLQADAASDSDGPAMAVVVQRMVAASAAGVAFSANPITGELGVIIEAAPGLGDAVVGGKVAADRYVVNSRGVLAETTPVEPQAPVLSEAEILQLAGTVRDLAGRAGGPRDIEWALDGDFHILQCRPITSLAGRRVYSNRLTADMAPGLVKPMVYTTNTHAKAREVFGKLFTELIGPNDYDFTRLTPRICSRVYADMTLMGELLTRIGLPPNFMEMMMLSERSERGHMMHMNRRTLLAMTRMAHLAFRHGRLPRHQAALLARWQVALEPYRGRDWSETPLPELLHQLGELVDYRNSAFWLFFVAGMGMAMRNALLRRWVERRTTGVDATELVRGLTSLRSLEPLHAIRKLGEHARNLPPDLREPLSAADPDELQDRLGASPEGRALLGEVGLFMDRFGFLSSNGSDFTASSWAENPGLVWRSIARAVESSDNLPFEEALTTRQEARRSARAQLGPLARLVFDRLLASVVGAIELREAVGLLMSEYSYEMRRVFLAIADRFVARGDLARPEDLFFLTYDEMQELAAGRLQPGEAGARIGERRSEYEADALIAPPSVVSGDPDLIRRAPPVQPEAGAYLSGIPGSSGMAQGRARVVHDPVAAPPSLCREDILVVPYTDVGWTPLFATIGGIVSETGGQLSHAAIVAREYGLPAIVGVKGATVLIREGQSLAIDGNRGRVYLEPQPDSTGGEPWIQ
jgi:rifampicin phosphotransferase